jgi:hypothetical protein
MESIGVENSAPGGVQDDFFEQQIPERLVDDALVQYFRSRYAKRQALRASLKSHDLDRIDEELKRIDRLRSHFYSSHEADMSILRESRNDWILRAKMRCKREKESVQEELKKLQTMSDAKSKLLIAREKEELRVLEAVPNLIIHSSPIGVNTPSPSDPASEAPSPGTNSKIDSEYGFTVSEITMRKTSPSGSYDDFAMKKYPLKDVLDGTGDDPLSEKIDSKTLRYFHFPANNMIWIEVECVEIDIHWRPLTLFQKAITRYHNEQVGEYNYRNSKLYCQRSSNFLCREYW